ncbi:MAG: helicase associated domain-containing protein, partial [Schwartzia sp.]|nr:helicase associated domain-containing protein [Schwartzia sp. (in: firmicutes)]
DASWQRCFAALAAYREEHGNLDIKANYVSPSGIKLGSWLSNLRTYRKNNIQPRYLTQERIESLDKLGMVWDVPDYLWERNYAACVEYHRAHGDLDIPFDYVTKEGLKLGAWIRNQRSARQGNGRSARLNEEQVKRLDGIGMLWGTKYDRAWEIGYTEAKAYFDIHKTLDIPATYITASGYKLGRWMANQRDKGKAKLPLDRQKRLDAIGMIWEKRDSWEKRYKLAAEYFAEHGNLRVPAKYKAEGVWLNKWLNEQRQVYLGKRAGKRLSEEQVDRLEAIGMTWDVRDSEAWQAQLGEAHAFYRDNGNLDIPAGYVSPTGKRLDLWIARQRKQRREGNLTAEQIAALDALGMVWTITDSWDNGYEHAKVFFAAKGHLAVPANYRCADGYLLGRWIANQRSAHKGLGHHRHLSEERIQSLEAIGMVWQINRRKKVASKAARDNFGLAKLPVPDLPIPENPHWNSEMIATPL